MTRQRFDEPYKGVLLHCSPTQRPNGRWAPTLVITDHRGGSTVEHMLPIVGALDDYETEREAADIARIAGRKWADDNA